VLWSAHSDRATLWVVEHTFTGTTWWFRLLPVDVKWFRLYKRLPVPTVVELERDFVSIRPFDFDSGLRTRPGDSRYASAQGAYHMTCEASLIVFRSLGTTGTSTGTTPLLGHYGTSSNVSAIAWSADWNWNTVLES
jgi:hypothetical protein